MTDQELVYKITSLIPEGKVLTYTALAKLVDIKNPREVESILHQNKDPKNIPCHRVVNSREEVSENYAFGRTKAQLRKLRAGGVEVIDNRVDLTKHL